MPGMAWRVYPRQVPSSMFGATLNSDTGLMPTFRMGSVRFWDSGTRWASLQPRRDQFDWTTLDRLVDSAQRNGLDKLFVIGGTPAWAAPTATSMAYSDGARTAPPDDLRDWDRFVSALAHRYRNRINGYELWPVGNDRRFFTGTPEQLVELTRRAGQIISRTDPKATVVCPGMGRLWDPAGQRLLHRFAELGGYRYCKVAGIKLHQKRSTDPPETMLKALENVDHLMHQAGVHPHLWSTGTTYEIPLQEKLPAAKGVDYAVRFYLVGLLGKGRYLQRMYFYNWGSTKVPIALQAPGEAPTEAALAIERLQRWLDHARIRACGHGLQAGLPANVWQCEFVYPDSGRRSTIIRWTDNGTADTVAPPGTESVQSLDGTSRPSHQGASIPVSERPILITING